MNDRLALIRQTLDRQNQQGEMMQQMLDVLTQQAETLSEIKENNLQSHLENKQTISAMEAVHDARLSKSLDNITLNHPMTRKFVEHILVTLNHKIHGSHERAITGRSKVYKEVRDCVIETFGGTTWEQLPTHLKNDIHEVIESLGNFPGEFSDTKLLKVYLKKQRDLLRQRSYY